MPDRRKKLRVDPIACAGVGICAHLAPNLIRVDSWGFPIVVDHDLDRDGLRQARSAVTACPRRALFVTER